MTTIIFGILEEGLVYAIMALGVYITYKILDFPDLSVDGTCSDCSRHCKRASFHWYHFTCSSIIHFLYSGCFSRLYHRSHPRKVEST
mgnify:FL=1